MTEAQWIKTANRHKLVLRQLIENYHPNSHFFNTGGIGPITAAGAEAARQNIVKQIQELIGSEAPLAKFDLALKKKDFSTLYTLLNDAWMGVPESRNCWSIVGFKEAVALLEDPPSLDDEDDE